MIKDMIAKLEADASAEASQKGWCDTEMTKALAHATAGLAGVKQAIKILKDFYEGTGLLQYTPPNAGADGKTVGDMAPDTGFDSDYSGNQDAASGIMGQLDVIMSDFEGTIEATNTAE